MSELPKLRRVRLAPETRAEPVLDVAVAKPYRSLEYDDSMTLRNIAKHIARNRESCEEFLRDYRIDRRLKIFIHKITGKALSSRNLHHYFLLNPHLYFPDSICRCVPLDEIKSFISLETDGEELRRCDETRIDFRDIFDSVNVRDLAAKFKAHLHNLAELIAPKRQLMFQSNVLSAAGGLLCSRRSAGVASRCDEVVSSDYSEDKVCIEYHFLTEEPQSGYLWCEVSSALCARILHSMVGTGALAGIAVTQFGMRFFFMFQTKEPTKPTKFWTWPETDQFAGVRENHVTELHFVRDIVNMLFNSAN